LIEHGGIWVFELEKFNAQVIDNEQARWLRFFKEGKQLNDENNLPDWMNTQEMKHSHEYPMSIFRKKNVIILLTKRVRTFYVNKVRFCLKKMRHLSVSRLRWLNLMRFQLNVMPLH
jgi:hypothetical protein